MKMAKASQDEQDRAIRFANELHDKLYREYNSDEDLGKWVREKAPPLLRVTFGYSVLVDNCCDPDATTLAWKPEVLEAMNDKDRLDAVQSHFWEVAGNRFGQWIVLFPNPDGSELIAKENSIRQAIDAAMATKKTENA